MGFSAVGREEGRLPRKSAQCTRFSTWDDATVPLQELPKAAIF